MSGTFVWILVMGLGMLAYFYGRDPERNSQTLKIVGLLAMSVGIVTFGAQYASAIGRLWSAIGIPDEFLSLANVATIVIVLAIIYGIIFGRSPSMSDYAKKWVNRVAWAIGIIGLIGIFSGIGLHSPEGWSQAAQKTGEYIQEGASFVGEKIGEATSGTSSSNNSYTTRKKAQFSQDQCFGDPTESGWVQIAKSTSINTRDEYGTSLSILRSYTGETILICADGSTELSGYGSGDGRGLFDPSGVRVGANILYHNAVNEPWMTATWGNDDPQDDNYWIGPVNKKCPDFSLILASWNKGSSNVDYRCVGKELIVAEVPNRDNFSLLAIDHLPEMRGNETRPNWEYSLYKRLENE